MQAHSHVLFSHADQRYMAHIPSAKLPVYPKIAHGLLGELILILFKIAKIKETIQQSYQHAAPIFVDSVVVAVLVLVVCVRVSVWCECWIMRKIVSTDKHQLPMMASANEHP